jgi:hypothetical protein
MMRTTWRCPDDGQTHEVTVTAEGTSRKIVATVCGKTGSHVPPWQLSPTAAVSCPACRTELLLAVLSRQTAA